MWDPIVSQGTMPKFWAPRPSRFWTRTFDPLRRFYLHSCYGVTEVAVDGYEQVRARIGPSDGVLLAPNHSHDSDPHVMMEVAHRDGRQFLFMAAWQIFLGHGGLDGWALQRMGAFSVDREGCDRRAIRQAVELLTGGQTLVVFPEGEVFHLNDRLTPLLEGVAFMALSAQKDLERTASPATVWIVPAAIRYRYVEDIGAKLAAAVTRLEGRLLLRPHPDAPLPERIIRVGEVLLTLQEKEALGHARDADGDLPGRVAHLIAALLQRLETEHLGKSPAADTVPLRVKALRRHLFDLWLGEKTEPAARRRARAALDEVQLVLRLYSYPGDYITTRPNLERMAETVEKFEEDIYGIAKPKGKRRAQVRFGDPINLKERLGSGKTRAVTTEVTNQLEAGIQQLMALDGRKT